MNYLFVIIGILACSLSQLLLKRSAGRQHRRWIFEMLNPLVIAAYAVFFASLIVNIWAMSRGLQLKELAMLESLGYVFVPLLSWLLLRERLSLRAVMGIAVIMAGIAVFYI